MQWKAGLNIDKRCRNSFQSVSERTRFHGNHSGSQRTSAAAIFVICLSSCVSYTLLDFSSVILSNWILGLYRCVASRSQWTAVLRSTFATDNGQKMEYCAEFTNFSLNFEFSEGANTLNVWPNSEQLWGEAIFSGRYALGWGGGVRSHPQFPLAPNTKFRIYHAAEF